MMNGNIKAYDIKTEVVDCDEVIKATFPSLPGSDDCINFVAVLDKGMGAHFISKVKDSG